MNSQYQFRSFSFLPPVVKNLLIINILFFVADMSLGGFAIDLTQYLGLHHFKSDYFYPFQYITYMFMHGSFSHLFFNMFALWMFGYSLENEWGSKKFLFYYLFTGVGAGLIQTLVVGLELESFSAQGAAPQALQHLANSIVTVGASGAVFGLLLAFGMTWPNQLIYIYFFIPLKAKWFVIIYGLIELFAGVNPSPSNVAHFAHLGGMLFGIFLILYWRKHDKRRFY